MKAKWEAGPSDFVCGEYLHAVKRLSERRGVRIGGVLATLLAGASSLMLTNAKSGADVPKANAITCVGVECEPNTVTTRLVEPKKGAARNKVFVPTTTMTPTTNRPKVETEPSEPIDKVYFLNVLAQEFDQAGLVFIESPTAATSEEMIVATKSADCALTFELDKVGKELRVTGLLAGAIAVITDPEIVARDTTNEGQTAHVSNSEAAGKDFELETVPEAARYLHKIALDTCGITSEPLNSNQ